MTARTSIRPMWTLIVGAAWSFLRVVPAPRVFVASQL